MNWLVLLLSSLGLLAAVSAAVKDNDVGKKCGQQPASMALFSFLISERKQDRSLSLVVQDCLSEAVRNHHGRMRQKRQLGTFIDMFNNMGFIANFMEFLQPMISTFIKFMTMFLGTGSDAGGEGERLQVETLSDEEKKQMEDKVLDRLTALSRMTHVSEADFLSNAEKYIQSHDMEGNKTVMLERIQELQNRLEEKKESRGLSLRDQVIRFRDRMRSGRRRRSISSSPIACLDRCVMTRIGLETPRFSKIQDFAERQGFSTEMMDELRVCLEDMEEMGCHLGRICQRFSSAAECVTSVAVKHWSPLSDLEIDGL